MENAGGEQTPAKKNRQREKALTDKENARAKTPVKEKCQWGKMPAKKKSHSEHKQSKDAREKTLERNTSEEKRPEKTRNNGKYRRIKTTGGLCLDIRLGRVSWQLCSEPHHFTADLRCPDRLWICHRSARSRIPSPWSGG